MSETEALKRKAGAAVSEWNFTPYRYRGMVASVYDGDTMTVNVDLGFEVAIRVTLRLYGIDTPEIRGDERPEGLKVRDWVRERVKLGEYVYLQTYRDRTGKYGRYLADVYLREGEGSAYVCLNGELLRMGFATKMDDRGRKAAGSGDG